MERGGTCRGCRHHLVGFSGTAESDLRPLGQYSVIGRLVSGDISCLGSDMSVCMVVATCCHMLPPIYTNLHRYLGGSACTASEGRRTGLAADDGPAGGGLPALPREAGLWALSHQETLRMQRHEPQSPYSNVNFTITNRVTIAKFRRASPGHQYYKQY